MLAGCGNPVLTDTNQLSQHLERIPNWRMIVGIALRGDPRNPTGHAAEGVPYANQKSALDSRLRGNDDVTIQEILKHRDGDQKLAETLSIAPAQQIALWADKLRDMSAMGLHYAKDIYERDRWQRIQDMAMEMHALATGDELEMIEPLRGTVYARPGPFVAVESAVIDDAERILLIRRADSKQWALPGGALDVGETGAQGAVREVLEETGVHNQVIGLVGVFDARLRGSPARHHFYLLIFLCKPTGAPDAMPTHPQETLERGWFAEHELPPDLMPSHRPGITHAFRVLRGSPAFFDH